MFELIDKMTFITSANDSNPFLGAGLSYQVCGVGAEEPAQAHRLKQVHGTDFVGAQAGSTDLADLSQLPHGDGLFSTRKGQVLAIKTADCLPVIIASQSENFICVIHAGWRGLSAGILKNGVSMAKDHSAKNDLFAFFGPCIGLGAFEVGPEVLGVFAQESFGLKPEQLAFAVCKGVRDRWYLDLAVIGAFELINLGLDPKNITILRSCTYSHPQLWNSYRRSGSPAPSNWTLAWI